MKKIINLMMLVSLFYSCRDACPKKCPENYVNINENCICNGLIIGEECMSFDEIKKYNLLYNISSDSCFPGDLPDTLVINVNRRSDQIQLILNIGMEQAIANLVYVDSDSAIFEKYRYKSIPGEGFKYRPVFMDHNEPEDHVTATIDNEICYLRPLVKLLDENLYRVHFLWETKEGVYKGGCTRIFHQ